MLLGAKIKQPAERLDYDIHYDKWFGDSTDTVTGATVVVRPNTMLATAQVGSPTSIKVWCEGGTDGQEYSVEVTTTTDAGRIIQDELTIICQEFQ